MPTLDWATRKADMAAADRVPYRLLDDVPDLSAGTGDPSGLLVQCDNLEALRCCCRSTVDGCAASTSTRHTTPGLRSSITMTTWSMRSGWA